MKISAVVVVNDHTHVASRAVVESSKVRQEMKKRARETEETPQQIISQSVALLSEQAAVAMPPIQHNRRDIRRQRKRAGNPLPVPQDKDFDMPPEYHQRTSGQQFLLFDSGHGEDRIIIFATDENVKTTTTGTDCSISVASPTTSVCEETVFLKTTKLPALCHPKRFF